MSLVGQQLGAYIIKGRLGEGGMAVTYLAYHSLMKRNVALKVVRPELASDPAFLEQFTREAQTIASLDHPRILPVNDFGSLGGQLVLVMKLAEGGSLLEVAGGRKNAPRVVAQWIEQIALGLDYAHEAGVLHLDLKPANILLDRSREPFLADFGIARRLDTAAVADGRRFSGTLEYMAPEQCLGKPLSTQTDLYALGALAWELLLGRPPFVGTEAEVLHFQVHTAPLFPGAGSSPVQAVMTKSLAKPPGKRYSSAREFSAALTAALGGVPAPVRPATGPETSTGPFLPIVPSVPPLVVRDATWFCALCGDALVGLAEGQPCRLCASTRAVHKPARWR